MNVTPSMALGAEQDKAASLECLIADAIFRSGYATLSFLEYELGDDRVVLRGRVPSYHLKQVAQALVQRVPGVSRVENQLVVQRHIESRVRGVERPEASSDRQQTR